MLVMIMDVKLSLERGSTIQGGHCSKETELGFDVGAVWCLRRNFHLCYAIYYHQKLGLSWLHFDGILFL